MSSVTDREHNDPPKPKKGRKRFGIEFRAKDGKPVSRYWPPADWRAWKWYQTERDRDDALRGMRQKGGHGFPSFDDRCEYRECER